MKQTFLVAGLGNPEGKYFSTYHNVGFCAVEKLADELGGVFTKKGNQLLCKIENTAYRLFVLKPLTYMNRSGEAVAAVTRKYKIAPENIVVVADDLYIDKGNIRVVAGGSHGGHNGIRSINELLGTNGYTKVKVGIKPEVAPHNLADYVLQRIDAPSRGLIDIAITKAAEAVLAITNGTPLEKIQSIYNTKNSEGAK